MARDASGEELFFEAIREHRGSYLAEYRPPIGDNAFATLSLVTLREFTPRDISTLLEAETKQWLGRYAVPLMSCAFDESDALLSTDSTTQSDHVYGWVRPDTNGIQLTWDSQEFGEVLKTASTKPNLATTYADLPRRTRTQVNADAEVWAQERRLQNAILKLVLVGWLAVIPSVIAIFEFLGPEWIGLAVLLFALWKALRTGLKLAGHLRPSRSETAKTERERKMQHYYYHCERNPLGFARLKVENFTEDTRQRTRKEAAQLADSKPTLES